ncbi:uncharacterized protein LOC134813541 isoform X4 [Bolinopsis microptera]|uniref:uncharacterized protein LOC134813541 isoform X4 n=1 Tax=Bolinopsis microptera TaxID=2820187 RepID=UPI003079A7B5
MTVSVWNPSLAYAPQPPAARLSIMSDEGPPVPRLRGVRKPRACSADHATRSRGPSVESSSGALEVIMATDDAKKKRRRGRSLVKQFEERQRIHERNEQKRREEALSSRRRRQQEATNAYKAALSKELNKRNKAPVSRISSASSIGSQRGRHIYRSPTVDEVLSNIRGHAVGGSLRTYGESSNNTPVRGPTPQPPSSGNFTPISSYTSPTYAKNVVSFNSRADSYHDNRSETRSDTRSEAEYYTAMKAEKKVTLASDIRNTLGTSEKSEVKGAGAAIEVKSPVGVVKQNRFFSKETLEEEILRDSLETGLLTSHYNTEKESERVVETTREARESDPDRIRVQIDLTKFDQLEVSDCESLDDPPIDPTSDDYNPPHRLSDKHTESYSDLSRLVPQKTSPVQLIQAENVSNRAHNYFGPPDNSIPISALRASVSDPNVSSTSSKMFQTETIPKVSSQSALSSDVSSDVTVERPNYTIQTSEGESFIYANSPVEAVKVASVASSSSNRTTAWSVSDKPPSGSSPLSDKKHLKSLIKRTPSARRKQVRWDSVSALDDETMEVDQFDISSEGEAVFTRQYSHPTRSNTSSPSNYTSRDTSYDDSDMINLQRTPTDAEINALWNKVRTTLHRNQAWDTPQSKAALPQRATTNRRDASPKMQDSLRIYSNVVMDNDRYKYKRPVKTPGQSNTGPAVAKMTDVTENGHTMLSMEEQRILQSLERLDAKLKDNGAYEATEPKTQIVTFSSPTLEVSRPQTRSETYKRLLNRKTNGISSKYR